MEKERFNKAVKLLHRVSTEEDMDRVISMLSEFEKSSNKKEMDDLKDKKVVGIVLDDLIHIDEDNRGGQPDQLFGTINEAFHVVEKYVHIDGYAVCILSHRASYSLGEKSIRNWLFKSGMPEDVVNRISIPKGIPKVDYWIIPNGSIQEFPKDLSL